MNKGQAKCNECGYKGYSDEFEFVPKNKCPVCLSENIVFLKEKAIDIINIVLKKVTL